MISNMTFSSMRECFAESTCIFSRNITFDYKLEEFRGISHIKISTFSPSSSSLLLHALSVVVISILSIVLITLILLVIIHISAVAGQLGGGGGEGVHLLSLHC